MLIGYINENAAQEPPLMLQNAIIADSVPVDIILSDSVPVQLYSFRAENIDVSKALELFTRSNGLLLECKPIVNGIITVNFENKTIDESMSLLLSGKNVSWNLNHDNLTVRSLVTTDTISAQKNDSTSHKSSVVNIIKGVGSRMFKINYPRLRRSGQGSSSATISSAASGQAGSVSLSTGDELLFWQELEDQLKQLVSSNGKIIVNKMAGVIYISDVDQVLDAAQQYIEIVVGAATRQVEITARIYEVTLNSDRSLGVDWSKVTSALSAKGHDGLVHAASNLIISNPDFKAATMDLDASFDDKINAIVQALKEQGEVTTISQPRVVTTNNQPALVKVGTDLSFFSATVTVNPTTSVKETQESIRTITVGVVLSVTPQISDDGWVTLGIDPLISDLVSTVVSQNGSTAPVIDVKQSSALVRLRDRHTVRISGLLQTKKNVVERKVPVLGDIPLLGYLFKWRYTRESRKELIIFITPRIM
jgi:MSHA type pilus biogenesis protein MshL